MGRKGQIYNVPMFTPLKTVKIPGIYLSGHGFFSFKILKKRSQPKLLKECLIEYQPNSKILLEICFIAFLPTPTDTAKQIF